MKIEGRRPLETQDVQLRPQKVGKQDSAPGNSDNSKQVNKTDNVQLSEKAKELANLKQIINQMPEIRTDKVEALKKAIQEGNYQVDSFKVAGKILEET
jgi:negative regulator of flagellin synthesis FlgM